MKGECASKPQKTLLPSPSCTQPTAVTIRRHGLEISRFIAAWPLSLVDSFLCRDIDAEGRARRASDLMTFRHVTLALPRTAIT